MTSPPPRSTDPIDAWTLEERAVLDGFRTPWDIQVFLDATPYSTEPVYRSPRSVMRDRRAHCADGALFAAAALRHLGQPPLIMELVAERDDDHLLAVFRRHGCYGAVAKSNFVGLRYREPVYRSLRELALTYFDCYFNIEGIKALRAYSTTLDLSRFDRLGWTVDDTHLEDVVNQLDRCRHYRLVDAEMVAALSPVDQRTYDGHSLGVNWDGVYRPT